MNLNTLAHTAAAGLVTLLALAVEARAQESSTRPATAPATSPAPPATAPVSDEREQAYLGLRPIQVTRGFDRAGEGYFSPDGRWIIFQATPKGETHYQMYVAELNFFAASEEGKPVAAEPRRITPPNSRNTCGYFSPDGKDVIFGSTAGKEKPEAPGSGYQRQGGQYRWDFPDGMEIYRYRNWSENFQLLRGRKRDPVTGRLRPVTITPPTEFDFALPANRLTDNNAYDAEGAYSPDGKHVVFTSRRTGDAEIWVMRADGTKPVQLTNAKGYDGGPFFAPDGRRIVYRSDRKGNDLLQIFVAGLAFDAEGDIVGLSGERQLTDDANVNWGPSWHPDGRHLIFATSRHGHHNYELYTIRVDGSNATRITYCPGFDGLPVFSPDGKHLMWSAKRSPDNTTQLFIAGFNPPADW